LTTDSGTPRNIVGGIADPSAPSIRIATAKRGGLAGTSASGRYKRSQTTCPSRRGVAAAYATLTTFSDDHRKIVTRRNGHHSFAVPTTATASTGACKAAVTIGIIATHTAAATAAAAPDFDHDFGHTAGNSKSSITIENLHIRYGRAGA
jgi:hypothetical protein